MTSEVTFAVDLGPLAIEIYSALCENDEVPTHILSRVIADRVEAYLAMTRAAEPSPDEVGQLREALEGDLNWLDALSQGTIERDTVLVRINSHRKLLAALRSTPADKGEG